MLNPSSDPSLKPLHTVTLSKGVIFARKWEIFLSIRLCSVLSVLFLGSTFRDLVKIVLCPPKSSVLSLGTLAIIDSPTLDHFHSYNNSEEFLILGKTITLEANRFQWLKSKDRETWILAREAGWFLSKTPVEAPALPLSSDAWRRWTGWEHLLRPAPALLLVTLENGVSHRHTVPVPFNCQVAIVPDLDRTWFFPNLLSPPVCLALVIF